MTEKENQENNAAVNYDRTSYILVVDDDNTLLKFFKIHLNKFFSKVIVVKNAKEAVEALRSKQIDLVISDIRMPRVTGLQLMKKVKKFNIAIPVLLVSGAFLDPEQEELIKEADGFLKKPFDVDQLHDFISEGLKKREKLHKIEVAITDPKKLRNVLTGKASFSRAIKKVEDEDHAKAATEAYDELFGKAG